MFMYVIGFRAIIIRCNNKSILYIVQVLYFTFLCIGKYEKRDVIIYLVLPLCISSVCNCSDLAFS